MNSLENDVALIKSSGLFDEAWYSETYLDVKRAGMRPVDHYVVFGATLGRNPSPRFDTAYYLDANPDVAESGLNPLIHYIKYGRTEGRKPLPKQDERLSSEEDIHIFNFDQLLASSTVFQADAVPAPVREAATRLVADQPKVSVIMPTWNRVNVVEHALVSAFGQSLIPHEVIVADDGSEDDTIKFLHERFPEEIKTGRLLIVECPHRGVSYARNSALKYATGDIVAYLDSDNTWHQDHLLYGVAALRTIDGNGCAYTGVRVNNRDENTVTVVSQEFDRQRLLRGNFIDLNAFLHSRDILSRCGGFDVSLTRLVDWELIIRYTRLYPIVRQPVVTVEYYLDKKGLGNISYAERIDKNFDKIAARHIDEYKEHKLLSAPTIARLEQSKKAALENVAGGGQKEERDTRQLYVVMSDEKTVFGLPYHDELDAEIKVIHRQADGSFVEIDGSGNVVRQIIRGALPAGAYWWPDLRQPLPEPEQLRSIFLGVATSDIDLAVLSFDLDLKSSAPLIACIRNQVVVSEKIAEAWVGSEEVLDFTVGKVVRMPPKVGFGRNVGLDAICGGEVTLCSKSGYFYRGRSDKPSVLPELRAGLALLAQPKKKPRVLVLPMKLAVGGVERNTVEVMRALRDAFDFIYVTMEKVFPEQGSLCSQIMETSWRLFDMAEFTHHGSYLNFLRALKEAYRPDVVWICNGSMWLSANAMALREVFDDVPIVDQQVYDVNEGWIKRYREDGVQSFDRFISINSKIFERFVNDFGMDPSRIDLIYSLIDAARFSRLKEAAPDRKCIRRKYEIPLEKKVFTFMGRLVDQKCPLDFLSIAKLREEYTDEYYVLVGNGVLAPDVEGWLRDNRPINVKWIPNVADTPEFWSCVDGLLVTSKYEGLPIAMLEALTMGVPVISTDVGDIRLVLEEHRAGVIVDVIGDPIGFSEKMNDWVDSLERTKKHLVKESNVIMERFSSDNIAHQYVDCWRKAIEQFEPLDHVGGKVC